jgi:tRNA U38,U39,U40 pseudouridine synthase TruA
MEYNLLKTIEPSFMASMMPSSTHPILTNSPAIDFVNPGFSHISRLYSFYVPLHNDSNIYKIQKQADNESEIEQTGSGNQISETAKNVPDNEIQFDDNNPEKFNEKKRKLLGEKVFDSFMHPKKFKTKTISLEKKMPKTTEKQMQKLEKKKKNVAHRFEFY